MEILPSSGTHEERIARFVAAIAKLRGRTKGGILRDPEEVVTVCARACGYRKKLFEARRKAAKR
jgi:hypothetical protein